MSVAEVDGAEYGCGPAFVWGEFSKKSIRQKLIIYGFLQQTA
jgi:hypothetical protein